MTYKTRRRNSKDVTQYMWRHIPAAGLEQQMLTENHDSDGI
jgi:hypothetical protein